MHRKIIALVAFALMLPVFATAGMPAEEEFNWSGTVAAGDSVEIQNLNGAIAAEYTSGNEVEIMAVKEGSSGDIPEVEIEVVEHANGITVCAIYPRGDGRGNVCAAGDDSRLNNEDNNKTRVTFRVRVPAGVEFDGNTMNGRLTADDMQSNLRLMTMSGAVDVEMGAADWTGSLSIESMNGSIDVVLPAGASADVDAETMNGRVSSDWDDVEVHGHRRNHANGTIGTGGRDLTLEAMNRSITLRRSR